MSARGERVDETRGRSSCVSRADFVSQDADTVTQKPLNPFTVKEKRGCIGCLYIHGTGMLCVGHSSAARGKIVALYRGCG